ncbi:MAG: pyridoxal-phosphate dependent enzyme [Saprospiraceae bacterium]|nr:pyridoxal-phosphate dependent enzyme [Saprospiraceae bacterium]
MIDSNQIRDAADRIRQYLYRTPCEISPVISHQLGCNVFLKFENQQVSGSFKARGAFNKILTYGKEERDDRFFVAASTGNHAAAFCSALITLNLTGRVYLPENVGDSKLEYIKSTGVPLELFGKNSLHTEVYCRKIAEENEYTLVHPYNDPQIIAGQGTVGLEFIEQHPDLDVLIVPVGGGGLIAGIAAFLKILHPRIRLIGCQPVQSPEMVRSIEQGHIIEEDISKPTLSDGTAGGMEPSSITFEICQQYVDEWALIEEDEIAFEIINMIQTHQMIIEGAAALPLAYLRKNASRYQQKNVGIVLTGKRISFQKLNDLLHTAGS